MKGTIKELAERAIEERISGNIEKANGMEEAITFIIEKSIKYKLSRIMYKIVEMYYGIYKK